MPFYVGQTLYQNQALTKELLKNIIHAITQLPRPKIISDESAVSTQKISADNTVICLQKEFVYVNNTTHGNTVQFLGTKNLISCILCIISCGNEYIAIHCDSIGTFDFAKLLGKFTNPKQAINITIIGGVPSTSKYHKLSQGILENIVTSIYQTAQKTDTPITIRQQKIFTENSLTDEDKYRFIYYKLLEKLNVLWNMLFKKPFPINTLIQSKKIADLKATSITSSSSTSSSSTTSHMSEITSTLALLLMQINEVRSGNSEKIIQEFWEKLPKNETQLYQLGMSLFCHTGFKIFDLSYSMHDLYQDTHCPNIVVNLQTGDLFHIPPYFPTPYEYRRSAALICPSSSQQTTEYFLAYDDGQYVLPPLSPDITHKFSELELLLEQSTVRNTPFFNQLFAIELPSVAHAYTLTHFARHDECPYPVNLAIGNTKTSALPIKIKQSRKDLYETDDKNKKIALTNQSLTLLQEHCNPGFKAYQRKYPKYTVDAHLKLSSLQEAQKIKTQLEERHITSYIFKFSGKEQYILCVPGINVTRWQHGFLNPTPAKEEAALTLK